MQAYTHRNRLIFKLLAKHARAVFQCFTLCAAGWLLLPVPQKQRHTQQNNKENARAQSVTAVKCNNSKCKSPKRSVNVPKTGPSQLCIGTNMLIKYGNTYEIVIKNLTCTENHPSRPILPINTQPTHKTKQKKIIQQHVIIILT